MGLLAGAVPPVDVQEVQTEHRRPVRRVRPDRDGSCGMRRHMAAEANAKTSECQFGMNGHGARGAAPRRRSRVAPGRRQRGASCSPRARSITPMTIRSAGRDRLQSSATQTEPSAKPRSRRCTTPGPRASHLRSRRAQPEPIECWMTDMDGVLVHEGRMIPGADAFIARAARDRRPFLVLTNNSIYTPATCISGFAQRNRRAGGVDLDLGAGHRRLPRRPAPRRQRLRHRRGRADHGAARDRVRPHRRPTPTTSCSARPAPTPSGPSPPPSGWSRPAPASSPPIPTPAAPRSTASCPRPARWRR